MSGMEDDAMSDNSIPFGHGASAFGSEPEEEDVDFTFHRPVSLNQIAYESIRERYDVERAASPAPSYVSMESDTWGLDESGPADDKQTFTTQIQLDRQDSSSSSCYSMSSDDELSSEPKQEEKPKKKPEKSTAPLPKPELFLDPNEKRHPALTVEFTFKVLMNCLQKLKEQELKFFKRTLWERYPECFRDQLDRLDLINLVDKMLELCQLEISLKITVKVLNDMKLKKLAEQLQGLCKRNEVQYELKNTLRKKYQHTYEGMRHSSEHQTLFESMYTDLHITDGARAAVNSQHEFRQIQGLEEEMSHTKTFTFTGLFDRETTKTRLVRSMIMKGCPGVGKSARVQRFVLDWVEGKTCEDVFFLLPMTFKELNQIYESLLSEEEAKRNVSEENAPETATDAKVKMFWSKEKGLISPKDLICRFYPEMKEVDNLDFEDCKIMFILDGFEDCTIPIDFYRTPHWSDHKMPVPLQFLIPNLIKGNMLYSAQVWVTTQPIKFNTVPPDGIQQVLEIRGFTNEQREAYFRQTVTDKALADKMIAHIKSCKTLYIMCHLPRFCWVVRKTLERDLQRARPGTKLPMALTQIYTNFVLVQISIRGQSLLNKEFFMKLGKMAFEMLEKDVFKIEKEHYEEHGLKPETAVITAGLCTQFYREQLLMFQEIVDCFLHPTIQEYLAALYVFLCFKNHKKNILDVQKLKMFSSYKEPTLADLLKSAVDKVLQAQNGKYNLFLFFLLGMSVETNQELLSRLLSNIAPSLQAREQTAHYIRKKMKETKSKDGRNEILQRCLDELYPQPQ